MNQLKDAFSKVKPSDDEKRAMYQTILKTNNHSYPVLKWSLIPIVSYLFLIFLAPSGENGIVADLANLKNKDVQEEICIQKKKNNNYYDSNELDDNILSDIEIFKDPRKNELEIYEKIECPE